MMRVRFHAPPPDLNMRIKNAAFLNKPVVSS
jgi:hypothetical protein